jgi:hypothetical protein
LNFGFPVLARGHFPNRRIGARKQNKTYRSFFFPHRPTIDHTPIFTHSNHRSRRWCL